MATCPTRALREKLAQLPSNLVIPVTLGKSHMESERVGGKRTRAGLRRVDWHRAGTVLQLEQRHAQRLGS